MATNMPRCIELMQVCYDHPDPAICRISVDVCTTGVTGLYTSEAGAGGRNVMDSKLALDLARHNTANQHSHCTLRARRQLLPTIRAIREIPQLQDGLGRARSAFECCQLLHHEWQCG